MTLVRILVALCMIIISVVAVSGNVCPPGFTLVGNSCYYMIEELGTKTQAQEKCRAKSWFAHLVSFQRRSKKNKVRSWLVNTGISIPLIHWTSGILNPDASSVAKYIWEPSQDRVRDFAQLWKPGHSTITAVEPCLNMCLDPPGHNSDYRLIDKKCEQLSFALCEIELCTQCKLLNGIYFSGKTDRCDCYVQCFFNGQPPILRSCSPGEFWDQNVLTCRPFDEVDCLHDPCGIDPGLDAYPVKNSVTLFWTCDNDRTSGTGDCCSVCAGCVFVPGVGCVPPNGRRKRQIQGSVSTTEHPRIPGASCGDGIRQINEECDFGVDNGQGVCSLSCTIEDHDVCPAPGFSTTEPPAPPCWREAVPGSPSEYLEHTPVGDLIRPCAPGTVFTPFTCTCGGFLPPMGNDDADDWVIFQSKDVPTHFIGLAGPFIGRRDRAAITDKTPYFHFNIIEPGLSGDPRTISLESSDNPGFFLQQADGGDAIFLSQEPTDPANRATASFIQHIGLFCPGCVTFEASTRPGWYITHTLDLILDPVGGEAAAFFATTEPVCIPELWIEFELPPPIKDISTLQSFVDNRPFSNPVSLSPLGFGVFTGDNRLIIPHFANFDFGKDFAIAISFDDRGERNDNTPLLANSDCAEGPSIELSLLVVSDQHVIRATVVNIDNVYFSVELPYSSNMRNDFQFAYTGSRIVLARMDVIQCTQDAANGYVRQCQCALQIGHAWRERFVRADIYDVKVYNCIPPGFIEAMC